MSPRPAGEKEDSPESRSPAAGPGPDPQMTSRRCGLRGGPDCPQTLASCRAGAGAAARGRHQRAEATGGAMASLGLLVWLLLLQPRLWEASTVGEGAQDRTAPPSHSPTPSEGGRQYPGASLWKLPPVGVQGPSEAPEFPAVSGSPDWVAFTPGGSGSQEAVAAPQTSPPAAEAARKRTVASGELSGPLPATENWPGLRAVGPALGQEGLRGSERTQPCPWTERPRPFWEESQEKQTCAGVRGTMAFLALSFPRIIWSGWWWCQWLYFLPSLPSLTCSRVRPSGYEDNWWKAGFREEVALAGEPADQ